MSNDDLEDLSLRIRCWRKLARLLISEKKRHEFQRANVRSSEKAYMMLMEWKLTECSEAPYKVLYDALCNKDVGRPDLARKFCLVRHLVST